jgi:two-component system NtrC family sensor kinase
MSESSNSAGRGRPADPQAPSPVDWSALFRRATPEGARQEIASRLAEGPEARSAFDAWRAARLELDRDRHVLEVRTRELALLQDLGRTATEATTPADLFRRAAGLLHRGVDADAVVTVGAFEFEPRAEAFVARPIAREHLDAIARRACEVAGCPASATPEVDIDLLDGFDESRRVRARLRSDDLVVLPIVRRGRRVASLGVLLPTRDEASLRVVYGAVNQLSLHLDRILTVREVEQDRFRSIVESMSQAVFLMDPGLRVLQANPAAARMLDELGRGRADSGTIPSFGDLDIRALAAPVLRGSGALEEGEAHLPDGRILTATLSAVTGAETKVEGVVLVIADVTERRRMEEQLARTEKLSSLGQMITGIAHELNNPLASVLGYSQLVRAASHDEQLNRRLVVIHDEARRCQRIVRDLLSFARRHEPERRPLSLNEVTNSVLRLIGYQLRLDNIEVSADFDPGLPPVLGDPHELQQAILNLVTNAQHAIREAGRGGTIRFTTARSRSGGVTLAVADDGPGIPEQHVSRIFDPFFTTKKAGSGTGLGLSIVYGIITTHGGSIELQSRPGGGASFTITLPSGTGRMETVAPRAAGAPTGSRRGTILVVDDEKSVAQLIAEALEAEGHRVVECNRVRDALESVSRESFDVVLLDLKMPGTDAEAFRDEVERRRPGLGARVLLVTGDTVSAEPEDLARRMGLRVLHKPFDIDDLREAVRDALG